MKGRVKSFVPRHYGFITAGEQDYRFDYKEWPLRIPPIKDVIVEFDPLETSRGWRATNIRKKQ